MHSDRFDEEALSVSTLEHVEKLCQEFISQFRAGDAPRIESLIDQQPPDVRPAALFYLIKEERELRGGDGQPPSLEEFVGRFPNDRDIVEFAWGEASDFEVELEVIIGPHRGRRFTFRRHDSFIVGRSRDSHFQIVDDPFFSRVHFLVEVNPPQCRLIDLCSLNGTQVNRHDVDWADLREGDLIVGGKTVIRVRITMPDGHLPPPPQSPPSTIHRAGQPSDDDLSMAETQALLDAPEIPGYELLTSLGRGGMGEVYLAKRTADGAEVAVKAIRPVYRPGQEDVQRFLREAQILCTLRHPHIVSFHQLGRTEEQLYIVMDYVPGSDSAQIVKYQGPMGIGRAVRLVTQALNALAFAHRQGYVHRDVKPSNLLISGKEPQETCRLADFGLARVYYESRMSGLTLLGTAGGTLQFMAPEQITNFRGVGPAADQYGAAATLYHLCTGQHLFPHDDDQDRRLMNILETEPVPIQQQRPDIPNGLARIIHKALTKDADDRFLDVGTFRAALMAYAGV